MEESHERADSVPPALAKAQSWAQKTLMVPCFPGGQVEWSEVAVLRFSNVQFRFQWEKHLGFLLGLAGTLHVGLPDVHGGDEHLCVCL